MLLMEMAHIPQACHSNHPNPDDLPSPPPQVPHLSPGNSMVIITILQDVSMFHEYSFNGDTRVTWLSFLFTIGANKTSRCGPDNSYPQVKLSNFLLLATFPLAVEHP